MSLPHEVRCAFESVSDDEWTTMYFELVQIADGILRRRVSRGVFGLPHVGGRGAADFVGDAFEALTSGRRTFNPAQKTVWRAFRDAVESEISNALTRKENQVCELPESYDVPSPDSSDETCWLAEIIGRLEDLPDLRAIVVAISEGYDCPRDLADRLGTDVDDIRNRRRRLKRWMARSGYAPTE